MLISFYFKQVWKEIPFIIIVTCGLALQVAFTLIAKGNYESMVLPTTYEILEVIRGFQPAILVLMALYSGELFSRDKVIKISPLMDVLPTSIGIRLVSQVLAMICVLMSLLGLLVLTGIGTQIALGFYEIDLAQYVFVAFTELLFNGTFIIVLTFFIQVVVNHKFMGHALVILLIIAQDYLSLWGWEHKLYQYANMSLGQYSDLIGYQTNSLLSFFFYSFYWLGLALLLLQLSKVLIIRGIETGFKNRIRLAAARLKGPLVGYALLGSILFIASGATIYVNTTVKNSFQTRKALERYKYEYELQLKQFENVITPEIIDVGLEVDLFPSEEAYQLKGTYIMVNSGTEPITEIHVQEDFDQKISTQSLSFDKRFTLKRAFPDFRYSIYELAQPLSPGDSLVMKFEKSYRPIGFSQTRSQYLPQTASFFTEAHLPSLGYANRFELNSTPLRTKFGLAPKERLPEISSATEQSAGLNSANNIAFEAQISTQEGYHAITSGQLIDQSTKDGRTYFHYKSAKPIENQYAIITGKLEKQTEYLVEGEDSIALSLYYHPLHPYNLEHISHAMRASFSKFQTSFSPYQYDRMNLMEVPRLHDFAMSVPNTIAFSESMGFTMVASETGLNVPFYITAHEVAHQWWGDQVRGALVKGEDMITETLAQYGAGIVTLQEFGEGSMKHILRFEMGQYLKGRKREAHQEQPLYKAEEQSYIHYGKGLISMMALRHYISEDSVNAALRRVIHDFPADEGIYATTLDVISEFRKSTPDSLQYLITDLFQRIIFLENRIQNASIKSGSQSGFTVSLDLITEKYESDPQGLLQQVTINDWIELAVYGTDREGKEIVIHRQMYKFDKSASTLTLDLETTPTRVVIDPAAILMDRNLEDNEWRF